MAQAARKWEADRYAAEVVHTPTDFERAFEHHFEEGQQTDQTRKRALNALAEKNWEPKVRGVMRQIVDEMFGKLEAMTEEEKVYFYAHLQEAEPEHYQALLDAIEDDGTVFTMTCQLIDAGFATDSATYEAAERALLEAEREVLTENCARIMNDPLYRRLTEAPIDTEGQVVGETDDLQVA